MRANRIQGSDLRQFEFDYDLTWVAFFMNADGTIYGRYGGQDAKSDVGRMSLAGLRFAMTSALETHKKPPPKKVAPAQPPLRPESIVKAQGCIHCHNIHEAKWRTPGIKKEDMWIYPLPDNVGVVLNIDQGNKVQSVVDDSPAAKLGIQPGDIIDSINGIRVFSFGDAQYALHKAPAKGTIPIAWSPANPMTTKLVATKAGASSPFVFNFDGKPIELNVLLP